MDAAIVLHGLFLLYCHTATQKCEIWVPHTGALSGGTDMHIYTVGFGYDLIPLNPQADLSRMMTINVPPSASPKFPFHLPDSGAAYSSYTDGHFTLNENAQLVPGNARNIISIPWPDEIFGLNRIVVQSGKVVVDSTDKSILDSPASSYAIPDTLVLHYKNANADAFTLFDENGGLIKSSAPIADSTGIVTQALILYSEPQGCMGHDPHTQDFDSMISKKDNNHHPTLVLTGDLGGKPGADDVLDFVLPDGVVEQPCDAVDQSVKDAKSRTSAKAAAKNKPIASAKPPAQEVNNSKWIVLPILPGELKNVHMTTATTTGCGTVSGHGT